MKRMKMDEIRKELQREIKAVYDLKTEAFENRDLNDFFRLSERLDGLHFAQHLLNGNEMLLGCYQTGMHPNSGGATYRPSKVVNQ